MKQKTYKAILTILDPEENTMDEKEYELDIKGGSLNDIEASVSNFRNKLLPNVELSIRHLSKINAHNIWLCSIS